MNTPKKPSRILLGCMSGTSLDGLDLALVRFGKAKSFELLATFHIPYSNDIRERLSGAYSCSGLELTETHQWFGEFTGKAVRQFLDKHPEIKPELVASHGHTIFHQPEKGFSLQIGHGFATAMECGIPVLSDFRSRDVIMGGQGAPLVPRVEPDLFPNYQAWLNLGGIANVSISNNDQIKAWDLAPCNMILNALCARIGLLYDEDGEIARGGRKLSSLEDSWNELHYWNSPAPKSLGREWVESNILPLFEKGETEDLLHTATHLIATSIDRQIPKNVHKIMLSGGGACNTYLVEKLNALRPHAYEIPAMEIVHFKEAIAFAYLGYLYLENEVNVRSSVTGSLKDHIGGVYYRSPNEL